MATKSGYWRSNRKSDKFWKWPNTDACIGQPDESRTLDENGKCADGYTGNMCQAWDSDYSRTTDNECASWPDFETNLALLIVTLLGMLLFIAILVKSALNK